MDELPGTAGQWTSSLAGCSSSAAKEPGAQEAYDAAKLAFELGRQARGLREQRGWSQSKLARAAEMTQPAVARFEAGGTVPTLPVLERLAHALGAELVVQLAHAILDGVSYPQSPVFDAARRVVGQVIATATLLPVAVTMVSGSRPEEPDGSRVNDLTPGPLRLMGVQDRGTSGSSAGYRR